MQDKLKSIGQIFLGTEQLDCRVDLIFFSQGFL